jgi:hypothetical protein
VATKLKDLKLDDAHATAVLEKAIEYESFTEDMPSSKRERIKAATDQVALMIDAWVDDEVTPENEDPDVAAMGEAISEIFEIAGVEVDEDGEVSYGEPGDIEEPEEEDEDDEDDEEEGGDDEAPVDIEDVVEGYDDLSAASRVKAIKALELDMEDDDDYNTAVRVYEYEEAQDKPSSRVLSFLDDLIPKDEDAGEAEEEEGEEEEPDEDEDAEEAGDGDGEEDGEWEAPWDKYDKQTAVEVKKHLDKLLAKDELTADMAQYVIDYETAREKPPTRKRVVDYATKLLEQLEGAEEEEPEEEEEEPKPPKRSKRPANAKRPARGSKKPAKQEEPDEEPEEEEDEAPAGNGGGIFVISGGDEDITAYGIYGAMGAVADLLAAGYEEVTVSAG